MTTDTNAVAPITAPAIVRLATRLGVQPDDLSVRNKHAIAKYLRYARLTVETRTGTTWAPVGNEYAQVEQAEQAILASKHQGLLAAAAKCDDVKTVLADAQQEFFNDDSFPPSSVHGLVATGAYELEPTGFDSNVTLVIPADGADAHYVVRVDVNREVE